MVSEKHHSHPSLIKKLNPGIDWSHCYPGMKIRAPNTEPPAINAKASFIQISLSQKTLEVFDTETNLIAHYPCSIGRLVEKRPVGILAVMKMAPNPNYVMNPENFPESPEAQRLGRKLVLPPGPNNPVGTAWIGLDKPGYGIHGTPRPEEVGRTESHGCFRLANWNAEHLFQLVAIGTAVLVEP
jgi:lipoprotein-anchoring transpeptidase ErfK/SrfK